MRKLIPLLSLLAAAALAACGQAAAPAATATPTSAPTNTAAPQATAGTVNASESCTQVTLLPTTGPTEASLFGPVTEQDWAQGPADARITIVEYSDFQ